MNKVSRRQQKHEKLPSMQELNSHADIDSKARGLKFDLSLYLHPNFEYVGSDGSGKSTELQHLRCLTV